MTTLRDIADRVGLSVSAVSMALTDHPRISEDAKRRVRDVASELGYVANAAGRALRSKRAEAIALAVPNVGSRVFAHAYFMRVLEGVSEVAGGHDAQILVATNANGPDEGGAYERVLRSGAADGVIVSSAAIDDPNLADLISTGLPVVMLGSFAPSEVHRVQIDDVGAASQATEHLIQEHGRRRLLHIAGPLDHQEAIDRRRGFLETCDEHGVAGQVLEGDFTESSARVILRNVIGVEQFDGLFAANDEMAYGAMTVLKDVGVSVPADVAITGFDDFGLSRVTTPSISTIAVPARAMAVAAAQRLFRIIDSAAESTEPMAQVLPVRFVPRQSCGCLPS